MPRTDLSPVLVTARERERQALEMRSAGATFASIGQALGVTAQGAHKAVRRALEATVQEIAHEADRLRALDAERIEAGIRALWPAYVAGELPAVDRMVRLLERRARLLGLDLRPPDVTVAGPEVIVIDARMPHEREEGPGFEVVEVPMALPAST